METQTTATAESSAARGSLLEANPEVSTTEQGGGPVTLILLAGCFGLVTGLLELALKSCRWAYDPATRLEARVHRYYPWMIPLADLLIFVVCGLVLGLLARTWPRAAHRLAMYLLCGLAALALVLVQPGLHRLTHILLACGIASLTAPLIAARVRHVRLRAGRVLPWLIGPVTALACFSYGRELLSERLALARLPAATPGAPNVLLIVLDTVRADTLSLYGYHRDTSPNLARLARGGVRFDRASSTAPWTLPSHASMFTGRWPNQLATSWYRALDDRYPTLAEALGARGYATAGFVANPVFCPAHFGLGRGFVHYDDLPVSFWEILRSSELGEHLLKKIDVARFKLSEILGDKLLVGVFGDDPRASLHDDACRKDAAKINRAALDWISARTGRPFFAFLNYYDAHEPYFRPAGIDGHASLKPSTPAERATMRHWPGHDMPELPPSVIKMVRDCYDDCVTYLDDQLGRLFNELETRGLLENTVVLITSDHGEHFGEHAGIFSHGKTLYRQETRVPLVVIAPGRVPSGQTIAAPVSLRDLPATVVDLVGLGRNSSFPGRSLARFWGPGAAGNPSLVDPVFAEVEIDFVPGSDKTEVLRSLEIGDMAYIRNAKGDEELYNIADDPVEIHNLAGSAAARPTLEHLRVSLDQLLALNPDPRGRRDGSPVGASLGKRPPALPASPPRPNILRTVLAEHFRGRPVSRGSSAQDFDHQRGESLVPTKCSCRFH